MPCHDPRTQPEPRVTATNHCFYQRDCDQDLRTTTKVQNPGKPRAKVGAPFSHLSHLTTKGVFLHFFPAKKKHAFDDYNDGSVSSIIIIFFFIFWQQCIVVPARNDNENLFLSWPTHLTLPWRWETLFAWKKTLLPGRGICHVLPPQPKFSRWGCFSHHL